MLGGADQARSLTAEQLERQRMLAMRAWEMPLRRTQPHPMYRVRRADATKALVWQGMGALAVLGAIMLVSAF
jgi:hypothetical protein